jgi:hypothetical protein
MARIAASAAFIHNQAAIAGDGPISATRIVNFIPQTVTKFI